jgi:hypothetical protein
LADLFAYLALRHAGRKLQNWEEQPSGMLRRLLQNAIAADDFPVLGRKAFDAFEKAGP